jgi:flagellar basal body P-ring formation protein FlgA
MRLLSSLLVSATLLASPAWAELSLRSDVLIKSDVVTLSDLIDGLDKRGKVSVFRAPDFGQSGTIQADRILAAARENGILNVDLRNLSEVKVRRAGRSISTETVQDLVTGSLAENYGLPDTIGITLETTGSGYFVSPDARIGLKMRSISYDQETGRFNGEIESVGAAATAVFAVSGHVADEIEVPIVTGSIERNTGIAASQIAFERRPRRSLPVDAMLDAQKITDMSTRRPLRKGDVLRQSDLFATPLVSRNESVILVVEMQGMTLTTRGRAMKGGARGDIVTVQNLQSRRLIEGVITGPGKVTVDPNSSPLQVARNSNP